METNSLLPEKFAYVKTLYSAERRASSCVIFNACHLF